MTLGELLEERGWSPDDVAGMLADAGVLSSKGKQIRPNGVAAMRKRDVPPAWRPALGLELLDDDGLAAGRGGEQLDGEQPGGGRQHDVAPGRPKDAPIVLEPGARKRIAGAYKFLGAALATGSGNEGVAVVWGDQADSIAQLWIDAAADNPWAARFVNMMSAGGSAGDLAAGHLYLAGATLYVLGARIPAGETLFPRYSRYRPVVAEQPQQPEPGSDGAADGAAQDPLAQPAG